MASSLPWTIGGESYQIADTTMIDESEGELTDGQQVTVNAHRDSDGTNIATLIEPADADAQASGNTVDTEQYPDCVCISDGETYFCGIVVL